MSGAIVNDESLGAVGAGMGDDDDGSIGMDSVTGLQSLESLVTEVTEIDPHADSDEEEKIESDAVIEARRAERKARVARLRRQRAFEEVYEPESAPAKLIQARHAAMEAAAEAAAAALRGPPKTEDEIMLEKAIAEANGEEYVESEDSQADDSTQVSGTTGTTDSTAASSVISIMSNVEQMPPGNMLPLFRQHPDKEVQHENVKTLVSGLPAEQGTSIMSRLFKRSVVRLRTCMKEPNLIRLVDDPCGPSLDDWSTAMPAKHNFERMLAEVNEALDLAPKADATARREFVAFQQVLAKKRTKAANAVSEHMMKTANYQKTFNRKHDDLIDKLQEAPAPKQPRIRNQLEKLKTTCDNELKILGLQLVSLQGDEAEVVSNVKSLEMTAIRVIQQWRPLHATLIQKSRLIQYRMKALVAIVSARIIQRTARRRLLMYCRGEPETDEEFVERMKAERAKNKKR